MFHIVYFLYLFIPFFQHIFDIYYFILFVILIMFQGGWREKVAINKIPNSYSFCCVSYYIFSLFIYIISLFHQLLWLSFVVLIMFQGRWREVWLCRVCGEEEADHSESCEPHRRGHGGRCRQGPRYRQRSSGGGGGGGQRCRNNVSFPPRTAFNEGLGAASMVSP